MALSIRFAIRRRLAADWTALNEVLILGEIGWERDTTKWKVGDGTTAWNSLAYVYPVGWAGSTSLTTLGTITTGTWQGTAIAANKGGTGQTAYAVGDVLYASAAGTLTKIGIGSAGQVFTVVAGIPAWATPAAAGSSSGATKVYAQATHPFIVGQLLYKGASAWDLADRDAAGTVADVIVAAIGSPVSGDGSFADVVSLLNFAGADATTTFSDPKRTWTAVANAQIDTSLGYNVGLFDGTADAITSPGVGLALGSTYTFECYASTTTPAADCIFAQLSGAYDGVQFRLTGTGIEFNAYNGAVSPTQHIATFTRDTAEHHYAVCCNGTNTWAYKDGVLVGSASGSLPIGNSTGLMNIGRDWSGSAWDFGGTIRGFRITKTCRYPGGTTFTPPALPLPESLPGYNDFTAQFGGSLTLLTTDWDAVIEGGGSGGLTPGTRYYAASTPGKITATLPPTGIPQPVLRAISATEAVIIIGDGLLPPTSGGGGISAGTSFPVSPNNNDLYHRTDLDLICYYDSTLTKWLTINEFTAVIERFASNPPFASTRNASEQYAIASDYQIYLTRRIFDGYVIAPNSGVSYWTSKMSAHNAAGTQVGSDFGQTTTQSLTADNYLALDVAINTLLGATVRVVFVYYTKVGSPGNFYPQEYLLFRKVIT